ncbi:hypothetical protein [Nonomuraea sp. NEAU-A123]|uniref:hypothetical protein n=1 Tax=Nonomuraea sp. NEAU-A123 TaxID=2839649 RepID=UPI001BE4633D|nr:hypothetical protein [Nonomuraea sp. NEAU-A123]MBT2232200.1 hypothetical protein [Nonomuraea sp. NEAU-A123]
MQPSDNEKYWQYTWLDELQIRSIKDYRKAIRKPANIERLVELQAADVALPLHARRLNTNNIVAGRRMDLSGRMGCVHFDCLRPQIDSLFGSIWHYFDKVTVDGHSPVERVASHDNSEAHYKALYNLEQRIRLLLHLRQIGAEPFLDFAPKAGSFCDKHFRKSAEEYGLSVLIDDSMLARLTDALIDESRIELKQYPRAWHYTLKHPRMDEVYGEISHAEDPSTEPTAKDVALEVIGRHSNALVMDVYTARALKLPLLQTPDAFWFNMNNDRSDTERQEQEQEKAVALEIRLPVLRGVPARELLRIRHDEWPHFERYRNALRQAIREQIAQQGERDPHEIAQSVVDEFIKPELAQIESKLKAVNKTLARKLTTNVSLGSMATMVGALSSAPLVATAGVATSGVGTIVASLAHLHKYFDDRSAIELSDLYFLWKVRGKHGS